MRVAFAAWEGRIAPVFDVARQLHLVEASGGHIVAETEETLPEEATVQKVLRMTELGVGTLVCGAVSRPMQEMITSYGIRVIPFVAGSLREVVQAWLVGELADGRYAMPGCWRRGRRRSSRPGGGRGEEMMMNGRGGGMGPGGGMGQGRGQGRGQGGGQGRGQGGGQGQGGRRMGRGGGPMAGGPGGQCVCPRCGYREAHERGTPCTQRHCPKCGVPLTRQ